MLKTKHIMLTTYINNLSILILNVQNSKKYNTTNNSIVLICGAEKTPVIKQLVYRL